MANSLRTRLFVTMAVLLAASVGFSALLSRRATLVEVRQVVTQPIVRTAPDDLAAVADRIRAAFAQDGAPAAASILENVEREDGRQWLLLGGDSMVVAASNPALASARVKHATAGGDLAIEIADNGARSSIDLRGIPTIAAGAAGRLYVLPPPAAESPLPGRPLPAAWIVSTVLITLAAVALTFGLSRRILRPVGELTAAAGRMQQGDLSARVDASGTDEVSSLARAFNTMADGLQRQEAQRRQMVADVAHELRAPVTNLRCTLEAMQDGLTPTDRAAVDILHEETVRLQCAIADLQDLALADAGQLVLRCADLPLAELVNRAVSAYGAIPGAPIVVRIDGDIRARVDPDRFDQVLRNLLSNARRHSSSDGRIEVSMTRERDSVVIEVIDSGSGIDPQDLPHVFDRFYRADPSRTRSTGGTGLGLAIAREIARAHGGDITASSAGAGRGATFRITVPS